MKILITGTSGFIGGSVGRYAAQSGHTVLGISRRAGPQNDWPAQYVSADVASADLSGVIRGFAPDLLIHAAGTASVGASLTAPLEDLRAATLTWANVLDGVRLSDQKPLVLFPSSAAVYGNPAELPVSEEMAVQPISPYGFHKAMCELLAREYAECFNLNIVVCRLFSVFGVEQRRLLVWELYERMRSEEDYAWLEGTGTESRDYLAVEDVASAFLQLAGETTGQAQSGCRTVNVASGQETSVLMLAETMRDVIAPHKEIRCRGVARAGDPRRWQADISRLRECAPDWQPQRLTAALERCVVQWQKDAKPSRSAS